MSKDLFYLLQVSSTLSAAVPLAISFLVFGKQDSKVKLFIVFLIVGFLTDLSGWYFYLTKNGSANIIVRNGYNLLEPVFLFWLVSQFSSVKIIKLLFAPAWIVLIPLWGISIYYNNFDNFKATTQVLIAFASSFCVLAMVEKLDNINRELPFWILLGVFFYNFSTFYFFGLMKSTLGNSIWYLHNIINIITNLIYFWGFWITFRTTSQVSLDRPNS